MSNYKLDFTPTILTPMKLYLQSEKLKARLDVRLSRVRNNMKGLRGDKNVTWAYHERKRQDLQRAYDNNEKRLKRRARRAGVKYAK